MPSRAEDHTVGSLHEQGCAEKSEDVRKIRVRLDGFVAERVSAQLLNLLHNHTQLNAMCWNCDYRATA